MKTNKKTALLVATVGLLGAAAVPAWAGYKASSPVYVNTSIRYAAGGLGGARNSADTNQYMGCSAEYIQPMLDGGTQAPYWYGQCYARDAAGQTASCYFSGTGTGQEKTAAAILGINGDSYVQFYWNATGQCTRVSVGHGSYNEPKAP